MAAAPVGAQVAAMEDNRFVDVARIKKKHLKELNLRWFAEHIDEGYFVDEALVVQPVELDAYAAFAKTCHSYFEQACERVLAGEFREEFGLSPKLWDLCVASWQNRKLHPHLFGRFDVAGIIDGQPGKLIEFNADTATVLAEAALVQHQQLGKREAWNDIILQLSTQLAQLASSRPEGERDVVIATLGGGEDNDNALVWKLAADRANLHAEIAFLPSITFSADEGVFRQLNEHEWFRFGILVKLFPWDWIDAEEPELLADFTSLIEGNFVSVVNPPYTALMQSKAMLAELYRQLPQAAELLAAGFGKSPKPQRHVSKPLFGREGENVRVVDAQGNTEVEVKGDYAGQPRIWQAFVDLPTDSDGDIYQAGVYWAGQPCGLAYRRRDGLIVDEDAEFVAAARPAG